MLAIRITGNQLRAGRALADLSMEDLAARARLSRRTLSKWEGSSNAAVDAEPRGLWPKQSNKKPIDNTQLLSWQAQALLLPSRLTVSARKRPESPGNSQDLAPCGDKHTAIGDRELERTPCPRRHDEAIQLL